MNLSIIIGLFCISGFCFILWVILDFVESNNQKQQRDKLINIIEQAIIESGLEINSWDSIKKTCQHETLDYVQNVGKRINRLLIFTLKYQNILSESDLEKLIDGDYFVGMTEEMVLESFGNPDKIEDEVLKTKTKRTYVYGNKNSGDVLVFEGGVLVRFKDR